MSELIKVFFAKYLSKLPFLFVVIYLLGSFTFLFYSPNISYFFGEDLLLETNILLRTLVQTSVTAMFIYWFSGLLIDNLIKLHKKHHEHEVSLKNLSSELSANKEHLENQTVQIKIQQQKHDEQLKVVEFLSNYDPLTKIPNRNLFSQQLTAYINSPQSKEHLTAVVFIDLQNFKYINNTLGHEAGDQMLVSIAEKLKSNLPNKNNITRCGGDEFAIILPNMSNIEEITENVQTILTSVHHPLSYNKKTFSIKTNAGISIYPNDSSDSNTLMKMAEIAMYRSRESCNQNYQFYCDDMELNLSKRLEIETDLQTALNENQFELYYQPQVDISGNIVGVEALIRWNHPVKGFIMPSDFIPVAEETGAIIKIGEWVIQTACKHNKMWQEMGLASIPVSVNLSAKQFQQADLQKVIFESLEQAALDPKWLTVEITETAAMSNADYTTNVLNELKSKGIKVSLDDFGMGYSSMIYLKRFPVDMLKIDRSFISDISNNSDGAYIAKAILGLGHNLKLKVVAEGVETNEQLEFLKGEKCNHVQGFLFSKPMPFTDMTNLFKTKVDSIDEQYIN